MLQILDDGRLTDSKGRLVDFKNCIIILTSNVGATEVKKTQSLGFASANANVEYEKMCDKYMDALKEKFRPEFLNRIDDIIVFNKLTKEETKEIASLMMANLRKRLVVMDITLEITDSAMDLILEKGYDDNYGARPLKRVIQHYIEDKLSEEILRGRVGENSTVTIDAQNGEFIINN
jgi:ATP-dependent Clp protease ATP-binding subunit ClpC